MANGRKVDGVAAREITSQEQVVSVGLGELVVSNSPSQVLAAFGLGSCVGVTAYDPGRRLGGLLHAMLPQRRNGDGNRTKFVDSGILELLDRLLALGARREHLVWRFAGGAQMLTAPGLSDRFNIGRQNVEMALEYLARLRLRWGECDAGGTQGRTLRLFMSDGLLSVRYVTGETRILSFNGTDAERNV